MRPLRFLYQHPVAVLGVAVCAFVVWVGRDAVNDGRVQAPPPDSGLQVEVPHVEPVVIGDRPVPPRRFLPPPPSRVKSSPQVTAQALPKLKPGMTRIEVEALVGAPDPADIRPATVTDGRVTYHTAYEADLGPLPTVRPVAPLAPRPAAKDPPRRFVTLEFDATKPGHPLLEIHYPDPHS